MKIFAITPNYLNPSSFYKLIRRVEEMGVSHIYLRSPFLLNYQGLSDLIDLCLKSNVTPVLPYERWITLRGKDVLCHFKEKDKISLDIFLKQFPLHGFTSSSHSFDSAEIMFSKGADFVFLSPVFQPYSKKNYHLKPLELKGMKKITEKYGERVVLLGGIDFNRVKELKSKLGTDFSVAGITMFFGDKDD